METRGAIEYRNVDLTEAPATIDVVSTLTSVDLVASSFVLTSDGDPTEVYVREVPREWLEALPIGRSVAAHFEHGVTLVDMADEELILAVIARNVSGIATASVDVGSVHLHAGQSTCVWAWWPLADGPTGCVVGVTETHLEGMDTSFARFEPGRFSIGSLSFSTMLVQSTRQATSEEARAATGAPSACGPAFTTTFSVVVVRDPS